MVSNKLPMEPDFSLITVFDVGARYGPHPTWIDLYSRRLCQIFAFEPESNEYMWLSKRYANHINYAVYNNALGNSNCIQKFFLQRHHGQSSLLKPNHESNWFKTVRPNDGITVCEQGEIQVITAEEFIDSNFGAILTMNDTLFLKTDTEGYDLEVIKGFGKYIRNLAGVRTEVLFTNTYQNCGNFSDIHTFMEANNFKLANLDYTGAGDPQSFLLDSTSRYGILNGSEAVYIRDMNYYLELENKSFLKAICFLINNSLFDFANALLLAKKKSLNINFSNRNCAFKNYIEIKYLKVIKEYQNTNSLLYEQGKEIYSSLFGSRFPDVHNYFRELRRLQDL